MGIKQCFILEVLHFKKKSNPENIHILFGGEQNLKKNNGKVNPQKNLHTYETKPTVSGTVP